MKKYNFKARLKFLSITLFLILLGLLSRSSMVELPSFIETYAGDTIWAMMVYFAIGTFFPSLPTQKKFFAAFVFSILIELSQLLKYEWLEALRQYKLVALVIGYGFKYSDLLCYFVGCSFAFITDLVFKISREK